MKNKQLQLLIVGLCLLVGFYLFSRQVKRGFLKNTDFAVTIKIQEKIDKSSRLRLADAVGNVMEGATFFASPEFSITAIIVITIINFITVKGIKKKMISFAIPLFFVLLILGEIYGKNVVHHPAPPFFMIKNPSTVFPKYYINDEFSYPSGHAARSLFIGISFLLVAYRLLQNKKNLIKGLIGGLIIAYVILVAISRIYLGHHWLSDIVGGWLLGGGFGLLGLAFLM